MAGSSSTNSAPVYNGKGNPGTPPAVVGACGWLGNENELFLLGGGITPTSGSDLNFSKEIENEIITLSNILVKELRNHHHCNRYVTMTLHLFN